MVTVSCESASVGRAAPAPGRECEASPWEPGCVWLSHGSQAVPVLPSWWSPHLHVKDLDPSPCLWGDFWGNPDEDSAHHEWAEQTARGSSAASTPVLRCAQS